jgi:glycolate oxidase iron-sulfur subunit
MSDRVERPHHGSSGFFNTCIHCGFCLPACPTYDVLGTEMDSPRGRLYLMSALETGRIGISEPLVRHLDLCLGCRACESECPSGVPYGAHLEKARERLRGAETRPGGQKGIESLILAAVALPPPAQRIGAALLGLVQRSGLARLVAGIGGTAASGGAPRVRGGTESPTGKSAAAGSAAPEAGPPRQRDLTLPSSGGTLPRLRTMGLLLASMQVRPVSLPNITPARGPRKLRVGFLEGCVNRWVFGDVNQAAARLLAGSGCEVVVPSGQRCCGALHAHSGELEGARELARKNIVAFEKEGALDAIIVAAAGCGAAMKDYGALLAGDPAWGERAARFSAKTRDALELLAELDALKPVREVRAAVAYHDACHLAHGQGVRAQPRSLLASVPGLRLVPLVDADRCCGSAGIYNVLHPGVAGAVLEAKLDRIRASGATIVAAANPGCLLQLAAGARRAGLAVRTAHPLELLDEACRVE